MWLQQKLLDEMFDSEQKLHPKFFSFFLNFLKFWTPQMDFSFFFFKLSPLEFQ